MDGELEGLLQQNKPLLSSENMARNYKINTGNLCSSKTITGILRKRGVHRLKKQARLKVGGRRWLYTLKDAEKFEEMSDTELGDKFSGQIFP